MRASTWALALAPVGTVAVVFLIVWNRVPTPATGGAERTFWDPAVVDFVRDRVGSSYVDELPPEKTAQMFYAALDAYVGALDPYSGFLSPAEYRAWEEDHEGEYGGIGARLTTTEAGWRIQGILPGAPADRAGLSIGEVVVSVDGRSLAGVPFDEKSVGLLKGPAGSRANLSVRGPPAEDGGEGAVREVTVVRDVVRPPTVRLRRVGPDGRFAHLRVTEFDATTGAEVDRHLDRLVSDGVRGVVLDLRRNGGGMLETAVHVADRFLREGEVVRTYGRLPGSAHAYVAKEEGTLPDDVAVVVLVDGLSASASELFAGALQDRRRALVVGTRTFGKFLVQTILPLPRKEAALKITTARYVTPFGRWHARTTTDPAMPQGLLPDVVVDLPPADATRLAKMRRNEDEAVWAVDPPYPDVAADWVDPQLARALEALAGEVVFQEMRSPPAASHG
jgi:carboxyl-terminal processing protease